MAGKIMTNLLNKLGCKKGKFSVIEKIPRETMEAIYDTVDFAEDILGIPHAVLTDAGLFEDARLKNVKAFADKLKLMSTILGRVRPRLYDYVAPTPKRGINLSAYGSLVDVVLAVNSNDINVSLVILLHGPPGTGKSFFASRCVYGRRERITSNTLEEDDSESLIERCRGSVIMIDEVDTMYENHKETLHNLLDDVKAQNIKTVIVMTTNNYDKLKNTPLVRPGRVDYVREIGLPTKEDIEKLINQRPDSVSRDDIRKRLGENPSIAEVGQAIKDAYLENLLASIEKGDRADG